MSEMTKTTRGCIQMQEVHFVVQRHARTVFEPQLLVQLIHCQVGAAKLDVGLEDAVDGRQVSLIRLQQLPRTDLGVKR